MSERRSQPERYRDLAAHCLRLSHTIRDERIAEMLRMRAAEFFELADVKQTDAEMADLATLSQQAPGQGDKAN